MVARLTGGQEAMGSSPVTPTTNFAECIHCVHSVFYIRSTCACANVETDIKTSTRCVPKFVLWNERWRSTTKRRARVACRSLCCGTSDSEVPQNAEHALRAEVCAVERAIAKYHKTQSTHCVPKFVMWNER